MCWSATICWPLSALWCHMDNDVSLSLPASPSPPPAVGLLPPICPGGPSLRLSSPHISLLLDTFLFFSLFKILIDTSVSIWPMSMSKTNMTPFMGLNCWKFRELSLPFRWIPNLGSEYKAHVWINLQMSITYLPNKAASFSPGEDEFEGPSKGLYISSKQSLFVRFDPVIPAYWNILISDYFSQWALLIIPVWGLKM